MGGMGLPFCGQHLDLLARGQKVGETPQCDRLIAMLGAIFARHDGQA